MIIKDKLTNKLNYKILIIMIQKFFNKSLHKITNYLLEKIICQLTISLQFGKDLSYVFLVLYIIYLTDSRTFNLKLIRIDKILKLPNLRK